MKLLVSILCLMLNSNAFAALSGNISISGVVPAVTSVTITPIGSYNALPLSTTEVDLVIANVQELNNTLNGYKVTATSSNSGKLKNAALGSMTYTAKYNAVSFNLSTIAVVITNQGAQTTVSNVVKPLSISYTGVPNAQMMQGTYSDTITLTIIAN